MSNRQKFEFIDDVEATWEIIDRLSRMVWERDSVSAEQKQLVSQAARDLHTVLCNASHDLPRREVSVRPTPPRGADTDTGQSGNGWRPFTIDRLARLVTSRNISSVAEAFLKATPVLVAIRETVSNPSSGFVFRGQRNIEWDLVPTLGRNPAFQDYVSTTGSNEFVEARKTKTSPFELDAIQGFRSRWDDIEHIDPIDRRDPRSDDDPSWWFRMQHYDENGPGTRLLDVTSSIPAALLFACLNWETGLVDDSTDGVIYLFNEGGNAIPVDFSDPSESFVADELFSGFAEVPVYFLNPPHNERSKAQAGAFLWWPKFWEPFPGQLLYLRVPKESKREIVKELLLLNYGPKDVVRGEQGLANERRLRNSLGLCIPIIT